MNSLSKSHILDNLLLAKRKTKSIINKLNYNKKKYLKYICFTHGKKSTVHIIYEHIFCHTLIFCTLKWELSVNIVTLILLILLST